MKLATNLQLQLRLRMIGGLPLHRLSIVKFITRNSSLSALCVGYKEKCIEEAVNTKFLRLQIDNHINWKNHIEQVTPKSSGVCYAVRVVVHISNSGTFQTVYCSHINSVMK
jgi:hypothetical protein